MQAFVTAFALSHQGRLAQIIPGESPARSKTYVLPRNSTHSSSPSSATSSFAVSLRHRAMLAIRDRTRVIPSSEKKRRGAARLASSTRRFVLRGRTAAMGTAAERTTSPSNHRVMIDASSRLQPSISFSVTAPADAKDIVTHNQSAMPRNNQRGVQQRACRVYRRQDVARNNHGFSATRSWSLTSSGGNWFSRDTPSSELPWPRGCVTCKG